LSSVIRYHIGYETVVVYPETSAWQIFQFLFNTRVDSLTECLPNSPYLFSKSLPRSIPRSSTVFAALVMKQQQGNEAEKVSTEDYYREYHGHLVHHLQKILPVLRASSDRLIWTAGDSSLDNKYWVKQTTPAIGGYEQVLDPPTMKKDVTYWLISHCDNSPTEATRHRTRTINTAVEATTLNQRTSGLLAQDVFLRDHIQSQDILVVSIGGNDIAMRPAPCTICALAGVLCLPQFCVEHAVSCGTCPCDDPCSGCGPSICTCACACPPCLGYFRHMFGTRIEHYVKGKHRFNRRSLSHCITCHLMPC
jgi:hypothetical protein